MKKILALILAILMLTFSFIGCEISIQPTSTSVHVHSFEEWDINKNPTCIANGEKVRYCSCGEKQTETIANIDHTPSEWIIDLEPTLETEGSMHIECTVCKEILKKQTIEKLAHPAPYGLILALDDDRTSYSVIGVGDSKDTDVIIPSTYNGLPVTSIGDYAFSGCKSIQNLTIPTSITTLGENIFYGSSVAYVTYEGTVDEWYGVIGVNNAYANVHTVMCKDGNAVRPVITLWVSTTSGVKEFTQQQINNFVKEHPEYSKYTFRIECVGEGDASTEVLKDVATAPDMYCFAQDQIYRLVQGGALAPLNSSAAEWVSANNDVGSVNAATLNGNLYAYPLTSDNGYYLYYDSSVISDEQVKTLEGIIAACKAANKKFGYNLTNAWIMAGFFFSQPVAGGAPICSSTWTYSEDGKVATGVEDNFNSANGLIAMKEMNELANSGIWVDQADYFSGTAAIVTGIWNSNQAQSEYGDNMKATKLPTFVGADGNTYQMGSFSGYKLLGCKPQTDEKKAEICNALAMYLTSGEAQLERYYEFQWGPSNLDAQANQDVQNNVHLAALLAQNVYAVPQGVIPGDWWAEAAVLGMVASQSNATDADLKAALETYEEKINAMIVR